MSLAYLEIDQARSEYTALPAEIRREFDARLIQSWLYHDHMLEGVVLTQADITRALEGRPCRNYCDRVIHQSLRRMLARIEQMDDDARAGVEVSGTWVKNLHRSLCDDEDPAAAAFRTRNTSPGVYHLDVVPGKEIAQAFENFLMRWETEFRGLHPIRAAALAHHEFMRVFPFDGRTGVVGRLMMNYILTKNFYPPAIIHASDRHHYFAALNGHPSDMVPVLVEAMKGTIEAARAFRREFEAHDRARHQSHRIAM
ncbi:Fic family protein [Bradymonas sediminis]|uniref:Uncharacterized protein n=1 Tax=Bradymonas sediminis TaxID=1548548 RepID=A0A2Z4FGM2_9DELT|nr:Fic family protein [Bradymonas sediminis]AWV87894.1 hypothetical protein DN745_00545 [Bradymonas sediminis]TDP62909.1 Fic/DOC family protein [Bradymonas sediminis]